MLQRAIEFATLKHNGQKRKFSDIPYVEHPISVMNRLKKFTNDEGMLVAAVLHDVLRDTNTTYHEIRRNFTQRIADLVVELTNEEKEILSLGEKSYDMEEKNGNPLLPIVHIFPVCTRESVIKYLGKKQYLLRKMNTMSRDALLIKLLDRLDNISCHTDDVYFRKTYKSQTLFILDNIKRKDLDVCHVQVIEEIREVLSRM